MRFNSGVDAYLKGDIFTEDLQVRYQYEAADYDFQSRIDALTKLCADKRVIHIGCVDHDVAAIEKKLKNGTWLHKRLCDVAQRCYGVDIQADGVEYMKRVLGYSDVETINILHGTSENLTNNRWDYVLLPEVLEHIGNPVEFLSAIRRRLSSCAEKIILTVPHALSRSTFERARAGLERINSDHRFWFTAYTLAKVLTDAGYTIDDMKFCNASSTKGIGLLQNWYYRKYPAQRNNILAVANL